MLSGRIFWTRACVHHVVVVVVAKDSDKRVLHVQVRRRRMLVTRVAVARLVVARVADRSRGAARP